MAQSAAPTAGSSDANGWQTVQNGGRPTGPSASRARRRRAARRNQDTPGQNHNATTNSQTGAAQGQPNATHTQPAATPSQPSAMRPWIPGSIRKHSIAQRHALADKEADPLFEVSSIIFIGDRPRDDVYARISWHILLRFLHYEARRKTIVEHITHCAPRHLDDEDDDDWEPIQALFAWMERICRSSTQAIPRFDLSRIEAAQVVNIVRLARDIGVDFGLMQVREQITSLYAAHSIEVVVGIWRRALDQNLNVIVRPLEDAWQGVLARSSIGVVANAVQTAMTSGLREASNVARRLLEDRLRGGKFDFAGLGEAIDAVGGPKTKVGNLALDNIVSKLNVACVGTEVKAVDHADTLPLSDSLKQAVKDRCQNPLGQEWPALGRL